MKKARDILSIGELAARTGVAVSAIRFYEEAGLIHPSRNAGGQRCFLRADTRRLSFILIAQQLGFTLDQIRGQLETLPQKRTPTKSDWTKISHKFRRILDERITAMESLRDSLDSCIGCGCLSLKKCALYNPQDRASSLGHGPRYLMGDSAKSLIETAYHDQDTD